jgi:hypothetical protein
MIQHFGAQKHFLCGTAALLLSLALFTVANSLAGQSQAPEDPRPYRLRHYDEDWSGLRDASHSASALEAIKYVALGEDGYSYVSFGGEFRKTYERFHEETIVLPMQSKKASSRSGLALLLLIVYNGLVRLVRI